MDVPNNHITYVPCLHENIAMGAAMGYVRVTDRPGAVQLQIHEPLLASDLVTVARQYTKWAYESAGR